MLFRISSVLLLNCFPISIYSCEINKKSYLIDMHVMVTLGIQTNTISISIFH